MLVAKRYGAFFTGFGNNERFAFVIFSVQNLVRHIGFFKRIADGFVLFDRGSYQSALAGPLVCSALTSRTMALTLTASLR